MENNCYTGTTNIPDPIIEPCGGIYKNDTCVIHESAIPYLNLPANSSVKNIISNLVLALLYKDEQIANQTTIIESLQEQLIPKYKVYSALLTQYSTNPPTTTVLENTLGGDVTWTYNSDGTYFASLPITIEEDKLAIYMGNQSIPVIYNSGYDGSTSIYLQTWVNTDSNTWTPTNDFLYKTPIEIRVYN